MADIRLAADLVMPLDAVTETLLILGKRGTGKTNTGVVLAEEMVEAGQTVAVIDPTGAWWGLRSSADGAGPGLPVVILGGEHGDLPLNPDAGTAVADLLVEERRPLVLDLSLMSKTRQRKFVTDFMERLYHRNREPLHLIIDEADLFAPQRGTAEIARLLGAYEDIVRRGRIKGIGSTSITQRPAGMHTDIRSQPEVLITLRLIGKHDIVAIDEWVRMHASDEEARELKSSLPSLPVGTAWVWSPGWLELLARVKIRERRTFDSSATPKVGQQRVTPRAFARPDPEALQRLEARLGGAPADQPAAGGSKEINLLQLVIKDLRRELAEAQAKPPERVEVSVLTPADLAALEQATTALRDIAGGIEIALSRAARPAAPAPAASAPRPAAAPAPSRPAPLAHVAETGLKPGALRVLQALAERHPLQVTRPQLGSLAGMKWRGGAFSEYYSSLRKAGYIADSGGRIYVTDAGLAAAGVDPASGGSMIEVWGRALKPSERSMLGWLVDAYPGSMTREQLAEAMNMTARGGAFQGYLGTLRSNDLVTIDGGEIRAADIFFAGSSR